MKIRYKVVLVIIILLYLFSVITHAEDKGQQLIAAVRNGDFVMVEELLGDGVSLHTQDNWGKKPLNIAVSLRDLALVQLFLAKGADVNASDNWQRTPLIAAVQANSTWIANVLIDHGADVNRKASNGITALIAAAQRGNLAAVAMLIEAGADINHQDALGWTALMWGAKRGDVSLIAYLLEAGANVDKIDIEGKSVLDQAEEMRYAQEVIDLFKRYGAKNTQPSRLALPNSDTKTLLPETWQGKRFFPTISGRVYKGNANALITIVEYTDFQCPYCSAGAKTVEEVLARYEGQVIVVVKHLPLEMHPMAMPAALYFEAIARQDKNKACLFYERVFQAQERLKEGEGFLKKTAAELAVNLLILEEDLQSSKIKSLIEADVKEADTYGFDGVPVFIVDGKVVDGAHTFATFCHMIDEAILTKQQ